MAETYVGVDVSKNRIDVYDPQRGSFRVEMERTALQAFVRSLKRRPVTVVLEATGGYERGLLVMLEAEGVGWHRANPARARHFARAIGVIGKTERKKQTHCCHERTLLVLQQLA